MGKLRIIIIASVMSILMIGIANAYVESGEFVTHDDWNRMVASMSETLEYLSNQYVTSIVEQNPKAKQIHDEAEKERGEG